MWHSQGIEFQDLSSKPFIDEPHSSEFCLYLKLSSLTSDKERCEPSAPELLTKAHFSYRKHDRRSSGF